MPLSNALPEQILNALAEKENYPLGTLAYYGPDDQTCTKIIASVVNAPNARPYFKSWSADNVCSDPLVVAEIGTFFKQLGVSEVVMTDGIIGCPHEEGIDYPLHEDCPRCAFWLAPKQS